MLQRRGTSWPATNSEPASGLGREKDVGSTSTSSRILSKTREAAKKRRRCTTFLELRDSDSNRGHQDCQPWMSFAVRPAVSADPRTMTVPARALTRFGLTIGPRLDPAGLEVIAH